MKGSLIIVAFFVAGVILARWDVLPQELLQQDFSMYVLYGLMFLVGISIGSDRKAWAALKGQQLRIVLVPLATIVGTLAGSIGVSFLFHGSCPPRGVSPVQICSESPFRAGSNRKDKPKSALLQ